MSTTHAVPANTQAAAAKPMSNIELTAALIALQQSVQALTESVAKLDKAVEDAKPRNVAQREMTDEDAKRVLIGDLADAKHNEAASKLGLSYGQVYSCRGEFTFKHIHKDLKAREGGFKNRWIKG